MKRARLLLLPLAMIGELLLLALSWMVAMINPRAAESIMHWAVKALPASEWYFGRG